MVLVLILLIGLLAGWQFGHRRTVLLLPTLICGLIQVSHIALSVATNTFADITLLPILIGILWLAATWLGAILPSARAIR
jgi:hypothetical protein